ncbi:MAG TPA: helix-turn-helix transcriptional regulator [Acidimicrobiales bacterium]
MELAAPRGFVLPAILLLLTEEAGYGYRLVKDLDDLGVGRIDRSSVYRALGQLEADGLVESWEEAPSAGQARRVYGITPAGARALRQWMAVVKEHRDGLDRVLLRYRATGTVDAMLAEVGGGWATGLRPNMSPVSPVSPTAPTRRRRSLLPDAGPVRNGGAANGHRHDDDPRGAEADERGEPRAVPAAGRFRLIPARSVVLIEARSSVGPISFGTVGLSGWVDTVGPPHAQVEVAVDGLRSGNAVYDAELLRRLDTRRFPVARLAVDRVEHLTGDRHRILGELDLHGVRRPVRAVADVAALSPHRLRITAEQVLDIRDHDVRFPAVAMLRIYPGVRVHLHLEGEHDPGGEPPVGVTTDLTAVTGGGGAVSAGR